jgi:hypothetical protein
MLDRTELVHKGDDAPGPEACENPVENSVESLRKRSEKPVEFLWTSCGYEAVKMNTDGSKDESFFDELGLESRHSAGSEVR